MKCESTTFGSIHMKCIFTTSPRSSRSKRSHDLSAGGSGFPCHHESRQPREQGNSHSSNASRNAVGPATTGGCHRCGPGTRHVRGAHGGSTESSSLCSQACHHPGRGPFLFMLEPKQRHRRRHRHHRHRHRRRHHHRHRHGGKGMREGNAWEGREDGVRRKGEG